VGYEYIKDKSFDPALTAHNYGGSVFAVTGLFPSYICIQNLPISVINTSGMTGKRNGSGFLHIFGWWLYSTLSAKTSFIVEVLVDVLQDDNSPYEAWDPWISVGVGVGF